MGEVTKSPLLPIRHEPDFFVCDIFDAAPKGDQASMEFPVFTLSKKPDMSTARYDSADGKRWIEIRPSAKGRATVFDRDVIIYAISQLIAARNQGRPISKTVRFKAYDLLIATNRDTRGGGRAYQLLKQAFERLQGTQIATNIITGGVEQFDVFSMVDRARVIRETRDGRMQEAEIVLSDWIMNAIDNQEVLTLDRRYFLLRGPLERRLYELARKHCGTQSKWAIKLENLQEKTGSRSTSFEFARLVRTIVQNDQDHGHFPGYSLEIDDGKLIVRPKPEMVAERARRERREALSQGRILVSADALQRGKTHCPGWDIHVVESDFKEWIRKKEITVENPDALFIGFCKKRGPYRG